MTPYKTWLTMTLALCSVASYARADVLLRERGLNIDGAVYDDPFGVPLPPLGGTFDTVTGLGTMILTISGAGTHNALAFVDHDIDKALNTSFNELGSAIGAPAAGQSWELGDPYNSTIFTDFSGAGLTDSSLLTGAGVNNGDDVSMALGWSFLLGPGETANITWLLSERPPVGGFYLEQTDPDSQKNIYFSSSLAISSNVPDGGMSLGMLGAGLFVLYTLKSRRHTTG